MSWQFRGNSQTQMNSIIYRTHLGRLLCPKPPLFKYFQGIYNFPGKLENPPACSLGHCLFPLWHPEKELFPILPPAALKWLEAVPQRQSPPLHSSVCHLARFANRGAFFDTLRSPPRGNRQPREPQGTIGRPQGPPAIFQENWKSLENN